MQEPQRDDLSIQFLGAAGTVTGSRYLIDHRGHRVLIDCGLFQGYKQLRLKNWAAPPFSPRGLDAIVLTHAHLDHTGYLPVLVNRGFRGPVFATAATRELCRILLPDSGFLQEEQARFANRHGYSKHAPALPLYMQEDAERTLKYFSAIDFGAPVPVAPGLTASWSRAGHLLGAASILVRTENKSILFSGDLGRSNDLLMNAPEPPPPADYLVVESTYGDRQHEPVDVQSRFAELICAAHARGGTIVVPTFAVGRAQLLMLLVARMKAAGQIPDLAVYLDSPMAIDATPLFTRFAGEHRLSSQECRQMCHAAQLVHTADASRELDNSPVPKLILAGSGMATGGRVIHHLKAFAPDPRNLILLAGFQAAGTRGASLAAAAHTIRIHGQDIPVRAEVVQLPALSAHADAAGLIGWMKQMPQPPKTTFITHGEPAASDALRQRVERELGWHVLVPEHRDYATLS
jgi:metallo-beta-lactamase family protein